MYGCAFWQGILAEEGTSSAELRAAAEGLGVLARVGGDVYAARLVCKLFGQMWVGFSLCNQRSVIAIDLSVYQKSCVLFEIIWASLTAYSRQLILISNFQRTFRRQCTSGTLS